MGWGGGKEAVVASLDRGHDEKKKENFTCCAPRQTWARPKLIVDVPRSLFDRRGGGGVKCYLEKKPSGFLS